MTQIMPERLEQFTKGLVTLDHGSHDDFNDGHCSMEIVAWLAGEGHTDAPRCASPVLTRYTIRLNDRWDAEQRQALAPFLPRMVGTGGDGLDNERERIALDFLTGRALAPWLRLAGMDAEADQLAGLADRPAAEQRRVVRAIRDRAWEVRGERRRALRDRIEKELKALNRPAAVADAVAAAAAVAAAVADADADPWGTAYWAARKAAAAYYAEHPELFARIHELKKAQEPLALELLEAMIKPKEREQA